MKHSKFEHDARAETRHLLRSPRNAEHLRAAIAELEEGHIVRVALKGSTLERTPSKS